MRSLFKRKNKKNTSYAKEIDGDRSTPPMITPIDPDGSTASHSSNEIYVTTPQQSQSNSNNNMTASQFRHSADDEINTKRLSQPSNSPYTKSNVSSSHIRSTQGKNCPTKSRDGVPIITSTGADHFSPSAVSSNKNYAVDGFYSKTKQSFLGKSRPKTRPSAKTSAFGGAPRYDWMDIVSYCFCNYYGGINFLCLCVINFERGLICLGGGMFFFYNVLVRTHIFIFSFIT